MIEESIETLCKITKPQPTAPSLDNNNYNNNNIINNSNINNTSAEIDDDKHNNNNLNWNNMNGFGSQLNYHTVANRNFGPGNNRKKIVPKWSCM